MRFRRLADDSKCQWNRGREIIAHQFEMMFDDSHPIFRDGVFLCKEFHRDDGRGLFCGACHGRPLNAGAQSNNVGPPQEGEQFTAGALAYRLLPIALGVRGIHLYWYDTARRLGCAKKRGK